MKSLLTNKSELVKKIQETLNAMGESLVVDGVLGEKTNEALKKHNYKLVPLAAQTSITTGRDPDEGTEEWYKRMFAMCEPDLGCEGMLERAFDKIQSGFQVYLDVAIRLKAQNEAAFAWILGIIHFKEASCNFKGCLHNGEHIIGTGKKTTIVPKGRGPFETWEDAAVDAIEMNPKRWEKLLGGSNDIGKILYALERYNGTGYITGAGRDETSPYLWACSNINDGSGKYVSDGKFDKNAPTNKTVGAGLLLKTLVEKGYLFVT